jgi:hypothetical protein
VAGNLRSRFVIPINGAKAKTKSALKQNNIRSNQINEINGLQVDEVGKDVVLELRDHTGEQTVSCHSTIFPTVLFGIFSRR